MANYKKVSRIIYILIVSFEAIFIFLNFAIASESMLRPSLIFGHIQSSQKIIPWKDEKRLSTLTLKIQDELDLRSPDSDGRGLDMPVLIPPKTAYIRERWFEREPKDPNTCLSLIRGGYLFFMEEGAYTRLSPGLKKELGFNVILVRNLIWTELASSDLGQFTFTTIAAMLKCNFRGKTIIDLGAGQGLLSLVAKKLGASKMVLVDNGFSGGRPLLEIAKNHLEINGYMEGIDFFLLAEDIGDQKGLLEHLKSLPLEAEEIVIISDIGAWGGKTGYTVTNISSLVLSELLEKKIAGARVTHLILGGYDVTLGNFYTPLNQNRMESLFLEGLGFNSEIPFQSNDDRKLTDAKKTLSNLYSFPKSLKNSKSLVRVLLAPNFLPLSHPIKRDFPVMEATGFRISQIALGKFLIVGEERFPISVVLAKIGIDTISSQLLKGRGKIGIGTHL